MRRLIFLSFGIIAASARDHRQLRSIDGRESYHVWWEDRQRLIVRAREALCVLEVNDQIG
jgi:hypothetical protein